MKNYSSEKDKGKVGVSNKPDSSESPHIHGFRESIQFYLIDSKTALGRIIDIVFIFLNLLIVAIFIIETYDISESFLSLLVAIEHIVVGFFIVEYIARLYGARNRLRHIFQPFSIIDFMAILPTFVEPFVSPGNIRFLILLRMFRVFRVLRFLRFFETSEFFFGKISPEMLKVLRLIMTIFMIFFVSSGIFYLVESTDNDTVNNFGDAFYFIVVTLTTVGFGDIIPTTEAGKVVTILCIFSGILLIPWHIGQIIIEWVHISQKHHIVCEHCGLHYHDPDAVHCKACGYLIYQEED